MISVVIPTFNAVQHLPLTLASLVPAAMDGLVREVVVGDGGSTDETRDAAEDAGARVVVTAKGRGGQLAAACAAAKGPWLLILHADTRLSVGWETAAVTHMRQQSGKAGYFRFHLDDPAPIARLWEVGVGLRCAILGLPYGDQGLLISKALYEAIGGFADMPLMEDVDLVRRLGKARLNPLGARALTRAERFQTEGYVKRSLRNWGLVLRFLMGAKPERLAKDYG
jgi:rSAM/selenodomain-associated transferase 2